MTGPHDLIRLLKLHGGAIVTAKSCSLIEINYARSEGRLYEDETGFGFVLRPARWLHLGKLEPRQWCQERSEA